MADIRSITNTLRGLRERASQLAAEGLEDAQAQIAKVYRDIGYSADLVRGRFGLLIGALKTNILQIVGDRGFVYMTVEPELNSELDGVAVRLVQETLYDRSGKGDFKLRLKPDSVNIETNAVASDLLFFAASQKTGTDYSTSLGVANPLGISMLAVANELQVTLDLVHSITGLRRITNLVNDTKAQQLIESGTIKALSLVNEGLGLAIKSVTNGARVAELRADAVDATLTLTDGGDTAAMTQLLLTIKNAIFSGTVRLSGLTASRPLKLDASKNMITGKISPTVANDIDVSGLTDTAGVKRSGTVFASLPIGTTNSPVLVGNFSVTTFTLEYLDHASNPQSIDVVVDVVPSYTTLVHNEGILTSVV